MLAALLFAFVAIGALTRAAGAFWDPVTAQCRGPVLEGHAQAIDGDTLELTARSGGRTIVHLMSLAAPELFQDCREVSGPWPCGREARASLDVLLAGRLISCTPCGPDGQGALEAICRMGDRDLNAEVLRSGFATSSAHFNNAMRAAQVEARREGRGLWRGDWVHPRAWRDGARLGAGACQGCVAPQ